ncbi:MAG: hypothetical protein FJY81_07415 [Candidatus Aminicenantes bacterium]|nr:hypothetical protein [Candidatus Aminicenantes bacterium]
MVFHALCEFRVFLGNVELRLDEFEVLIFYFFQTRVELIFYEALGAAPFALEEFFQVLRNVCELRA